tara:strand:- start:217 stop:495 length:279 start_codon:yes stop_codon:yes gene_type:complete
MNTHAHAPPLQRQINDNTWSQGDKASLALCIPVSAATHYTPNIICSTATIFISLPNGGHITSTCPLVNGQIPYKIRMLLAPEADVNKLLFGT